MVFIFPSKIIKLIMLTIMLYVINLQIGDAYVASAGMFPSNISDHALRCVEFALCMQEALVSVNEMNLLDSTPAVQIRLGVASGPAIGGLIGSTKPAYLAWGKAITEAELHEQAGQPGRVRISQATWDLICANKACEGRYTAVAAEQLEDGEVNDGLWVSRAAEWREADAIATAF